VTQQMFEDRLMLTRALVDLISTTV
jgi:hypothetical protein